MEQRQDDKNVVQFAAGAADAEDLPYAIELLAATDNRTIERVLARAHNSALAQAIFRAAQTEHPGRVITLRRGAEIIAGGSGA